MRVLCQGTDNKLMSEAFSVKPPAYNSPLHLLVTLFGGIIFHSANERSHWIKRQYMQTIASILLKNANLNNSIVLKVSVIVTFIVEMTNGIFRCQSKALLYSMWAFLDGAWAFGGGRGGGGGGGGGLEGGVPAAYNSKTIQDIEMKFVGVVENNKLIGLV